MKIGFLKKRTLSALIKSLETSILGRECLHITASPPVEILPHRLVYLQGRLSLIGENTHSRQLVILDLQKIGKIRVIRQKYQNNFSAFDIDRFIEANRKMSDQEYRLVVKLPSLFSDVDLGPKFHFFGNPCLVSNPQGELIWGASVELNDEFLKWLDSIKNEVHIIDPPEIQHALNQYIMKKT